MNVARRHAPLVTWLRQDPISTPEKRADPPASLGVISRKTTRSRDLVSIPAFKTHEGRHEPDRATRTL